MLEHSRMQQGRDDGGDSGIQGKDEEVLQYGHSTVDVFSACKANLVRSPVPWMNGMELLEDVLKNKRALPTGFDGIDTLLGGGLREGQLIEIVGPSSSGKTQFCLFVASYIASNNFGSVVYMNTSNCFSPSRVSLIVNQLCSSLDKEDRQRRIREIMSRIHCLSIFDIFSLMDALDELKNTMREQKVNEDAKICILVVDAISSLVTPILGSTNAQGRSLMVFTGYLLKRLAYELDISVLVTNHMVSGEGGMAKPAMGESWKPVPHIRLLISRKPGSKICDISLLRHTSMACGGFAEFVIPD
ncbi:hypothetical protein HPP92_017411 [Vanilla planifolia]|uniref:RecA family profile 1 domain-containing protein n=1 Tax=Vanilla planifolia TaxID=51239 RepID=A0A835UNK2_VANPL|nr:hypothetical protein HPP92_017411 [Vanilla planifolia]